jgi:O-Antigen ligase
VWPIVLVALPFLALDLALALFAFRRPWLGLILLLGLLPLNGGITQVVPHLLKLPDAAQLALAGWHDSLVAGIALAAAVAWLGSRQRRLDILEWLIAAMLVVGAVYVAVSPVLFTGAYVYRVLYEPPLLLAAIVVLARSRALPSWVPVRAALALITGTTLSALYAWVQVYLLGFPYLQTFYTDPGKQIHHSFLATGLSQPRAIGLLHSPNEFGAALAIAIALLCAPSLLPLRGWVRTWLLGVLALALLLSFSRSGWLATMVAVAIVLWLSRGDHSVRAAWRSARQRPAVLLRVGTPVVLAIALAGLVFASSGAAALVKATATGSDPSAGNRPVSVRAGLTVVAQHPLGLGLGTAGPKAARFDEQEGQPRILTETWYILYAIQVGVVGLGLLLVTAATILWRLWRDRMRPLSRAALGIGFGLGVGAVFIPVIEDPSVFTPLWAFCGMALALGAAAATVAASQPASPPLAGD